MAHPVDRLVPDIGRAGRRHHIDEDPQRRRQMHAAAEQHAEIPAEQGRPVIWHHPPHQRQPRERRQHRGADAGRRSNSQPAISASTRPMAMRIALARRNADSDRNIASDRIDLGAEIVQHGGELRQHEHEKERQHAGGGEQDEGRIARARRSPCGASPRPRPLAGQHFEHLVERAGSLADADQRHIHRREQCRIVPPSASAKAFAGEHAGADLGHDRAQAADVAIGGQQFEAVIDAGAGPQQQRQVAGEDGDVLGARLVEQAEAQRRGAALFDA